MKTVVRDTDRVLGLITMDSVFEGSLHWSIIFLIDGT